jgi:hypothetical protein
MAFRTFARVTSLTFPLLLSTLETVAMDTPAFRAMSFMLAMGMQVFHL